MKTVLFIFFFLILGSEFSYGQDGWYQKASHGGNARHRCTAFAIGNKGYLGGGHINSGGEVVHEDYWQYDPSTNTWSQIADFGGGKRYHSVAFTIDQYAYVGCGEDAYDTYYNDFWKYVPLVNTWFPAPNLPGNPRRGSSSFVIDGIGYVGGGQSDFGYENDFYKFDPISNSWSSIAPFISNSRSGAVAFAYDGKGYYGTGHVTGAARKDFYCYDPATDTWEEKAIVGTKLRQDATGFVLNGKGYILTGNNVNGDSTYKDVMEYDFETDTWTEVEEFPGSRRRYMVSFVINNVAYAGSGTNGTNLKDFWAFQPLLGEAENVSIACSTFPNPSSSAITIQCGYENYPFEVYNMAGRKLKSGNLINGQAIFNKEEFGVGIYIVSVQLSNCIKTEKIIFN